MMVNKMAVLGTGGGWVLIMLTSDHFEAAN